MRVNILQSCIILDALKLHHKLKPPKNKKELNELVELINIFKNIVGSK
jgi:hypothetical protein